MAQDLIHFLFGNYSPIEGPSCISENFSKVLPHMTPKQDLGFLDLGPSLAPLAVPVAEDGYELQVLLSKAVCASAATLPLSHLRWGTAHLV